LKSARCVRKEDIVNKRIWNVAILTSMLLAVPVFGAEKRAAVTPSRERSAPRVNQKVVVFKTDRTDSWLCNNVSAFFCTDLFPTLTTTQNGAGSPASLVPDRSRTPGH
jgi:hypothetical protein